MAITIDGTDGISPLKASGQTQTTTGTAAAPAIASSSDTDSGFFFGTNEVNISTGGSTRAKVDSSGNVGIGTTSPSKKLHIDSSADQLRLSDGSGGFELRGGNVFKISDDGTERIRVDGSGNFGIGVSPQRKLHLDGGSGSVQIQLTNDTTGKTSDGDGFQLQVATDGTARVTQRENLDLLFDTNNTERFKIAANGRVTAQVIYGTPLSGTTRDVFIEDGGQLGYISSVRDSKVNINLLSNVDWIYQLQPSSFNYKLTDQEGAYTGEVNPELEYGLIAEDVEPIAPELCFYDEVEGEMELRGIHYKKLIVPLLKALQEANAKIATLQTKVAALEAAE